MTSPTDPIREPCLMCGTPVVTGEPGSPKAKALCGLDCIKAWCAANGSEFLTMDEYAARNKRERKASEN